MALPKATTRPIFAVRSRLREVADRALQLGQQIVEHRPHGLEHGLRIGGRRGVALQVLGLGEGELHLLGQRLGEMVAAQAECSAATRDSRW